MLHELMAAFDRGELESLPYRVFPSAGGESGVPFHGAGTSHWQGSGVSRGNAGPGKAQASTSIHRAPI